MDKVLRNEGVKLLLDKVKESRLIFIKMLTLQSELLPYMLSWSLGVYKLNGYLNWVSLFRPQFELWTVN